MAPFRAENPRQCSGGRLPLLTVAGTAVSASAWTRYPINPCAPDSAITCDGSAPHVVYTPTPHARNELAVFFGGTFSTPGNYDKISENLAAQGYHVINMRFVNDVAVANLCPNTTRLSDPECHRKFRAENMWGENVPDPYGHAYDSTAISVGQADSIANRLLKLVNYLATTEPYEGQDWGQFRDTASFNATYGTYDLVWALVAIGGHSQGAGIGLYAGKFYGLMGVSMFAGPQDSWNDRRVYIANWITQGGFLTATTSMFGFGNDRDALYPRQTAAWAALNLPGAITSVTVGYPYGHSHRLKTTSYSALCAHSSAAEDACTPGNPPTYAPVWNYMYDGG